MANHAVLNHIEHKNLKVITTRSAELGDDLMLCRVYPIEFRQLQAHYPIFLHLDPKDDQYYPVALFGFEHGENLFLNDHGWDASYVPMLIEREPFLMGAATNREGDDSLVMNIDLDNPRVNEAEGEALFLDQGQPSQHVEKMASMLRTIHEGEQANKALVALLREYDLIESFFLDIELNDGSTHRLSGFHTINEEKLAALPAKAVAALHAQGDMQSLYMMMASISSLKDLITRKNARVG